MRWSKLKKLIESQVTESLQGRVEFHSTCYYHKSTACCRGWITCEKKMIASFCNIAFFSKAWWVQQRRNTD